MLSQRILVPGLVVMLVVLVACDLTTPSATPTPVLPAIAPVTPSPPGTMPAAASLTSGPIDAVFISQAISATQALSRYHYHYQATGRGAEYDTDLEGDYLGFSEGYTKGRVGGQQVEHIFTQGRIFRKAGDRWVPQAALELPAAESLLTLNPGNFGASLSAPNIQPLGQASAYLSAGQDFQDSGVADTIGSIRARRITFTVDATKFSPGAPTPAPAAPVSSGSIWIEQASHHIVQIALTLPPGALLPNPGPGATPLPAPTGPITYQFTFSRLDDPALALPPLDLSQALTPLPATPNAGLPPLVAHALDTLDHLHNVHYDQTMTDGPPNAGDYVPTQPGQWRQLHASTDPVEYTLLYLAIAQDFQDAGPVTVGTVATEAFHFAIPWFGEDRTGTLAVPPDARSGRIPFIGEGTVAIDPTTHYIMRLVVHRYKDDVTSIPESTSTLLLTQHDAASSAGPAPMPSLIPQTLAAMDALQRYHVQIVATTGGFTDTFTNDIDVVAPNSFYIRTNQTAYGSSETLQINGQTYIKSDGSWLTQDGMSIRAFPGGVSVSRVDLRSDLDTITFFRHELAVAWDFRPTTVEPVNGVPTQAFTFKLAPYSPRVDGVIEPFPDGQTRPPIGNGTIYINPATRLIQKLVINQAVYTITDYYYDANGTSQSPPAGLQLHVTITYSRPNDPSLTLPSP